jgi:hypothetical protein
MEVIVYNVARRFRAKGIKMYNFTQVLGSASYRPWKKWEAGDFVVGKFDRTKEDNYGKENYLITVLDVDFDNKDEQPAIGSQFGLNSSGALVKAFEEIEVGDVVKVIYRGEDEVRKGKYAGKKFHSMEVLKNSPLSKPSPVVKDSDEEVL